METKMKQASRKAGFISSDGGNAIMIFGLTIMPVLMTLGAATDYARYTMTRAALQQAADSAALMVASRVTPTTTESQAKAQAQVIMRSQSRLASATVSSASLSNDKKSFCVDAQVTINTAFMKIASFATLTPTARSCADTANSASDDSTLEVALVVDNSGSMSSSAGGVSKMQALKTAAASFIDTMYARTTNVKMSVTPFAAGVAVLDPMDVSSRNKPWIDKQGNNSQHWIAFGGKTAANAQGFNSRFDIFDKLKNIRSSWDWGGCLEQPVYPTNVNDVAPNPSDPETLFVPFLAPDEPSGDSDYGNSYISDSGTNCSSVSGQWNKLINVCKYKAATSASSSSNTPNDHCPNAATQTILQLTPTKEAVSAKINQLVESGNTNLHEGFMWGWRTLSPNQPFAGGRSYSAPKNRKIMVFMTDGANNWKSQPDTATGSTYQALGYYSYNGAGNMRFPDGSAGDGVNYRSQLQAAGNSSSNYWGTSRDMQDELTREACANAKEAGIEVFTIGFSTPGDPIDAQGLALLKSCATNADHYFKAEDAAQLNDAFASVSSGLAKLHLSE